MRYEVLTAKTPNELKERANAVLVGLRGHVRSQSLASHGRTLVLILAIDETPAPADAAERWMGRQLTDQEAS